VPTSIFEKVQDVVHDRQQRCAAVAHGLGIAPLLLGQVGVQQQAGHADHAIDGCADLVAHVGQKIALGPAGLLREVEGILKSRSFY